MEEKIEGILLPENHKERKTSMIQYARFLWHNQETNHKNS
jgi:hypothetical protein